MTGRAHAVPTNPLFHLNLRVSLMLLRRTLPLLVLALCLFCVTPIWAASGDKLKKIEAEINNRQKTAAELEAEARAAADSLSGLRQKLIEATAALQAKLAEQQGLEDQLQSIGEDIESRKKSLAETRARLKILISAVLELARRPPEVLFLQSGLSTDFVHRSLVLRNLVPEIEEDVRRIGSDIISLQEAEAKLERQKKMVVAARTNLEKQQSSLDELIRSRQGMLKRTEAQRAAIQKQLDQLSHEAKNLRQLMERVTPKRKKSPNASVAMLAISPPVDGRIQRDYGHKDGDGVQSEGITYRALPSSPIAAPAAGRVVFLGPFRGYGQVLILQHEGGYHSFLAGFGRIDVDMGQEVEAGEPLGVVPSTAKASDIYFEWRRSGEPADPNDGFSLSKRR